MDLSTRPRPENEGGALSACLKVPFPSDREAEIAYNSLRVDPDPKRSACSKKYSLNGKVLQVEFTAKEARQLRVGVNSFFELLLLTVSTLERFGPPVVKS